MKKLIILLSAFVLLFLSLAAQNPKKGFKYLRKHKYEQARAIFNSAKRNPKYYIAAYYGLAQIYYAKDYKHRNLDRAYTYINYAKNKYNYSGSKHRRYIERKFKITATKIFNLYDTIVNTLFYEALNGTVDQMTDFVQKFEGTDQAKIIERKRDSIVFQRIKKANQFELYRNFEQNYPNTVWADSARNRYQKLWKTEYNRVFRSLEYFDIKNFKNKYPDYPFYDDSTKIYEQLATKAYELQMIYGYNDSLRNLYINFIHSAAPSEMAFVALQRLLSPQIKNHQWREALNIALQFKNDFQGSKKYNNLIELLQSPEPKIHSQSFSDVINSPRYQQYAPVLSIDGKTLYFASQNRPGQMGEDIYVSYFKNGDWSKPQKVSQLSSSLNEAPLSLTADGNTLLMFYNGDVYYTQKTKSGWSPKKPISEINTDAWEADAFITADGNAIFFVSDRKGNIGGYHKFSMPYHGDYIGNTDIYVIVKQKDGSWSKPINLGPTINTPYAERSPYLHPDMKTLYFSSEGHGGLGRMDIFVSHRLSDTSWTQWSEPINLGKAINTPDKEYGYKITADGTKAYFAKINQNNTGIYYIDLPPKVRPQAIAIISGVIKDKNTGEPIEANIVWENLETGKKLGELKSDPISGKYTITLPVGKNYGFYISKNNYYPISDNVDLRTYTKNVNFTLQRDFKLLKIKELLQGDEAIELNNVFFDFNKATLRKESFPELNRLANFLKKNPNIKIEISGHTDNIGSDEYNQKLSEQRAKAVKNYLVSKGCDPQQMIVVGYGSSKPIASNKTEQGRQKNRRVEFRIIKK